MPKVYQTNFILTISQSRNGFSPTPQEKSPQRYHGKSSFENQAAITPRLPPHLKPKLPRAGCGRLLGLPAEVRRLKVAAFFGGLPSRGLPCKTKMCDRNYNCCRSTKYWVVRRQKRPSSLRRPKPEYARPRQFCAPLGGCPSD